MRVENIRGWYSFSNDGKILSAYGVSKKRSAMLKENDPVVIYETGEVGYVEKILDDEGDRLMVRIPPSGSWPYPQPRLCG
jgi:intein/homing endonuclease